MNLVDKLNMDICEEINSNVGVVFCGRNLVSVFQCKPEFVEEALNDAGYHEEDGDYNQNTIIELCEIIDDFGSEIMASPCVLEKQIWFDEKRK